MKKIDCQRLQTQLNYQFKNEALLTQALTHRSAHFHNNERLEFLGDSLLSVTIASALYHQFPLKSEGELSRLRASLVKGETLASIAQDLNLGQFLILGQGELKSGGHRRASILADALEALFASVYLDSDFITCQQIILRLYETRLKDSQLDENSKDAKTALQEYLQAQKIPLPKYHLTKIEGESHAQVFYISCRIASLHLATEGVGETRRKAEQEAAKKLFEEIKVIATKA